VPPHLLSSSAELVASPSFGKGLFIVSSKWWWVGALGRSWFWWSLWEPGRREESVFWGYCC